MSIIIDNARPIFCGDQLLLQELVLTLIIIAVVANGTLYIDGGSATFIDVNSAGNQHGNITEGYSKFPLEFIPIITYLHYHSTAKTTTSQMNTSSQSTCHPPGTGKQISASMPSKRQWP